MRRSRNCTMIIQKWALWRLSRISRCASYHRICTFCCCCWLVVYLRVRDFVPRMNRLLTYHTRNSGRVSDGLSNPYVLYLFMFTYIIQSIVLFVVVHFRHISSIRCVFRQLSSHPRPRRAIHSIIMSIVNNFGWYIQLFCIIWTIFVTLCDQILVFLINPHIFNAS